MTPERPLVLFGAGNMGGALLAGWLQNEVDPASIVVVDPAADAAAEPFNTAGLRVFPAVPQGKAGIIVIAVKPNLVDEVVAAAEPLCDAQTLVIGIAAGVRIAQLRPPSAGAVVRAMPNTPSSVGRGATVAVAQSASEDEIRLTDTLLSAVGRTWWVDDESFLDAVTAVSGSGPAYVFHLTECLAEAARKAGLPDDLADGLARQTVIGAGALLDRSTLDPGTLRRNVTSKGGTTAAALGVLMDTGALSTLMTDAVKAATARSRQLGR